MKCPTLNRQKVMFCFFIFVLIFVIVFNVGCGGGAYYYPYRPSYTYTGLSSHFKQTTGTSNLKNIYKEPPTLDVNVPLAKFEFELSANEYLAGVVNDLKEVNDKSNNAAEKIKAVVDAVNIGFEHFSVPYVGSVITLTRKSNFGNLDYPEFPDFDYFFLLAKPQKPLYLDNELRVAAYNIEVERYNKDVANLRATVKDYIEDAEHYIENCENDYKEIRQKGLNLLSHIESANIDTEIENRYILLCL